MSLNYIPRGDRILVRRLLPPEPEPGKMVNPLSQTKPLNAGIVLAVGPGARNRVTGQVEPIADLQPGDIVEFVEYAQEVEVDGETLLLLRDEEIHGKRRKEY